ncbi:S1 RNA-binding domain-containing protein [bacterium]|nr:S1 RNA-binding domain-containing protein [bacterium]
MSEIGSIVRGKVQKILPRGAIVMLENGERGFVHISEIADEFVEKVEDFLKEGESVNCRVLGYDDKGRLELSIKRTKESSEQLEEKLRQFRRQSDDRLAGLKKREANERGRR